MTKITVYFDYGANRSSSYTLTSEKPDEEIADIKWRVERFGGDLTHSIPEGDKLKVESKSVGNHVAAYTISSSLSFQNLQTLIATTAKGLKLKPDLKPR